MATIDETGLVLDTLDTFRELARQEVRNTIPEADLSDGSDYDNLAELMASDSFQHEFPIVYGVQQIFLRTADTPYLVQHGNERKIPWPEAATSSGYGLLTGTAGSTQGGSSPLSSPSDISYQTTAAATIVTAAWASKTIVAYDPNYKNQIVLSSTAGMQAGDVFEAAGLGLYCIKQVLSANSILIYGRLLAPDGASAKGKTVEAKPGARVPVVAVDAGASGNARFYDVLTLSGPAAGINATVPVLEISGGADKPTDEEYAILLQDVDAEYPAGGNRSQLLLWGKGYDSDAKTLRVLGIARCFFYDVHRGLGTGDLYPQGIARARHLSTLKLAELQTYIAPAAPDANNPGKVAPGADILVRDFTDLPVDVTLEIQGGPGYGPDWTGTFTIGAGGTVQRVPLTADPTGRIVAGNRVALRIGVNLDLVVATVDTVDPGGLNLSEPLDSPPIAGETLYPGSSLIEPVRDAVLEMFDSLGPGDTTPPTRYPAPTTQYPANLDRALIFRTVRAVTGVNNMRLPAPANDVLPASAVQCVLGRLTITHY